MLMLPGSAGFVCLFRSIAERHISTIQAIRAKNS